MPELSQMFPSKFLEAGDLQVGALTPVTIERVSPYQAKRPQGSGFDQEAEIEWIIKFREYRKPARMKPALAKQIAGTLDQHNTDTWAGQAINIFPIQALAYGEMRWFIACDVTRPDSKTPKLAPGPGAAVDKRPIGQEAATRFLQKAAEAKADWEVFLKFLKLHIPGGIELAFGIEPAETPAALLPAMKQFLDLIHAGGPATPMERVMGLKPASSLVNAGGHLTNPTTGEVMGQAARSNVTISRAPAGGIDEADIPF